MRWFHKCSVKVGKVSSKNMVLEDKWVKCMKSVGFTPTKISQSSLKNPFFSCKMVVSSVGERTDRHRQIHEWSVRLGGELFGGLGVARWIVTG